MTNQGQTPVFSPIGNPRSVFPHTPCPSTTSEVNPSLGRIHQGLGQLAVRPNRTLPQPRTLSLPLDESIRVRSSVRSGLQELPRSTVRSSPVRSSPVQSGPVQSGPVCHLPRAGAQATAAAPPT
eukprot:1142195-Pyramimonas_sp.AAC.1